MKNKNVINLLSVVLAVILVLFALIYTNFSIEMLSFTIAAAVFAAIEIIRSRQRKIKNIVVHDELSEMIALKSFRNSWLVTINVVAVIGLLAFFNLKTIMLNQAITILIVIMIITFQASRLLYSRNPVSE